MVDAALYETACKDALFGAAAPVALDGEIVGVVAVPSAGVLVPDLKNHSSRVCVFLSADHLCSPVGSMHCSGTWNLPAAIACAFCFQSLLAAMLAACFYVPGLLFKGMEKVGCKKRKITSSFLPGRDLPQASCLIRVEGHSALASAELEEGHESFNNIIPWEDVSDAVVTESPGYQCAAAAFEGTSSFVHSGRCGGGSVASRWHGWSGCVCHDDVVAESLMVVRSTFIFDSEEKVVKMCQGSGRVRNASRRVAGQCVRGAIGVGQQGKIYPSSKGKGSGKGDIAVGPLGRKPPPTAGSVPPTTRRPQVVPPRGPLGAGVGSPPSPESPPSLPSEELVKALLLLQSVLTPEDFSKYEKKLVPAKQQERVKLRERELLEAVERQAKL